MTMNKETISLLSFLCLTLFACEQNKQEEYIDLKRDIDRIDNMAWDTSLNNPTYAIELTSNALKLANSIQYVEGISNCLKHLGIYYDDINDFDKAEKCLSDLLALKKKLGDKEGIADAYGRFCSLESSKGDYLKAIQYGFEAIDVLKQCGKYPKPTLYNDMGLAHQHNRDFKDAEKYYKEGIEFTRDIENSKDLDSTNLAILYYNLGRLYREEKEFQKADSIFQKVFPLIPNRIYEALEAATYDELSILQREFGNIDSAFTLVNIARSISSDALQNFHHYHNLCLLYSLLPTPKYEAAINYCDTANTMLDSVKRLQEHQMLNEAFGDIYNRSGDYEKAVPYLLESKRLSDTIFNQDKNKSILKLKKERAEKAKIASDLENKKLSGLIGISSLLLLLMAIGLYAINQRRLKKQKELEAHIQQRKQVIKRSIIKATREIRNALSIRVHKIGTPLDTVETLIEDVQNKISFSPELYNQLAQAINQINVAYDETRDISYRLKPEKKYWLDLISITLLALELDKKIETKIDYQIKKDSYTDEQGELIAHIIHALINNVKKHAKAKQVKVDIKQVQQGLKILVQDNGKGFNWSKDKGVGLQGVREDIQKLNGTLTIKTALGKGSEFQILIPNNNLKS